MTSADRRPTIVAFTGSTRRPSKSRALAEAIGRATQAHVDSEIVYFDILDAGRGLGSAYLRTELSPEALAIVEAIEGADAVIAITPTYKASYTGLFKHLIDFLDGASLRGKPVVVGATGAGQGHALAVEHQLKPLFGFFSAVLAGGVYAADSEFTDGVVADPALIGRVEEAARNLARILRAEALPSNAA